MVLPFFCLRNCFPAFILDFSCHHPLDFIPLDFLIIKIPLYRVIQRGKQRMDAFLCQKCPTKNRGTLLLFLQGLLCQKPAVFLGRNPISFFEGTIEILIIILNQVIQNILTVRCLDASAAVVGCFFQRGYHMAPQEFRERKAYA